MEGDPFWNKDWKVLVQTDRLIEFWPTEDMTDNEKLNAITRLVLYTSLALFLYNGKRWPLYIPVFGLAFIMFMHQNKSSDTGLELPLGVDEDLVYQELSQDNQPKYCRKPTKENPFMNVLVSDYTDNVNIPEACRTVPNEVEDNFNHNLYKDVGDVFSKNNGQRQFVTNPSTTIPNDQDAFREFLYKDLISTKTCKEGNGARCLENNFGNETYNNRRPYLIDPNRNPE